MKIKWQQPCYKHELDYGESQAIILANEISADYLIIDEKKARKIAQISGLKIIGTIGLLQKAKDIGIIRENKTMPQRLNR